MDVPLSCFYVYTFCIPNQKAVANNKTKNAATLVTQEVIEFFEHTPNKKCSGSFVQASQTKCRFKPTQQSHSTPRNCNKIIANSGELSTPPLCVLPVVPSSSNDS